MGTATSEEITLVSSRSGLPNVAVDGVPYHSPYDPEREASKFYAGLPLEGADVVVHFGWGLGYAARLLRERCRPDVKILVLEPDEDLHRLCRREGPGRDALEDPRFRFIVGPQVRQLFDDWGLEGCRETDRVLWVEWPRSLQRHTELARVLQKDFKNRLRDQAANLLTHFENGRTYFENAVRNLRFAGDPVVGNLFGRFEGVPLVLVSAGPSLDRNIRHLQGLDQRCFILAVDTALRPLLAAGVKPHAVMIADPSQLNAQHILGAMPPETYLIAEQAVDPSAFRTATRRFQFSVGVFPDGLYREFGLDRTALAVWGSVATAALDLACRMGADPVIFVGQDFAYSWGRDYASHTIFHGRTSPPGDPHRFEPDVWGRPVPTTESLIAYRDAFLRRIKEDPRRTFINASEGGILTERVDVRSLKDALYRHADRTRDVRARLEDCYQPGSSPPFLRDHLLDVLSAGQGACGCVDGFLELVAKQALLEGDREAIAESQAWGVEVLSSAV